MKYGLFWRRFRGGTQTRLVTGYRGTFSDEHGDFVLLAEAVINGGWPAAEAWAASLDVDRLLRLRGAIEPEQREAWL